MKRTTVQLIAQPKLKYLLLIKLIINSLYTTIREICAFYSLKIQLADFLHISATVVQYVGIEQFGEYRKAKHKKQNCTKNILYTYEHVRCAQNRKNIYSFM